MSEISLIFQRYLRITKMAKMVIKCKCVFDNRAPVQKGCDQNWGNSKKLLFHLLRSPGIAFYKSLLRISVIWKSGCWWVKSRSGILAIWAPGGAKKWYFIHQTLFLIENEHRTQMFHSMGPKTGSEINFVSQLGSQKLSLYSSSKRS